MSPQEKKSNSSMMISQMESQKRARFALLAKVGIQKRALSRSRAEADFYCSLVTELLAVSGAQYKLLERLEEKGVKQLSPSLFILGLKLNRSMQQLLSYWPEDTESQARLSQLLDSAGVAMLSETTPDGWPSPSQALILKNVERAIEVSRMESSQKQSSNLEALTT